MHLTLPSGTAADVVTVADAPRGLVVIPDIWGLRPLFSDMCSELAERTGWSVGCFDPFAGRTFVEDPGPSGFEERSVALTEIDDARLLGDAVATADATDAEHVGIIGFCMGGMYALKAAGTRRFDRVAAFYGMIRVPDAWIGPGQGQPLDALADRGDTEVMAVIGTVDSWTPPEDVESLESAGVAVVRYEGADHGFVHDPSRPAHRPDDAADAWQRALAFLSG